jgi:hypothetical protein
VSVAEEKQYQSLYRKYRPQGPGEILGQDHVIRALSGAVREGRLAHAFLFSGPRGTGKTSTARILAKMVNCEQGPTPEPCGTCDQCVSIREGQHLDVVEIDAASHGGVDDARDLREKAPTAPVQGREKVYIIDEAQRLSREAFDALLVFEELPRASGSCQHHRAARCRPPRRPHQRFDFRCGHFGLSEHLRRRWERASRPGRRPRDGPPVRGPSATRSAARPGLFLAARDRRAIVTSPTGAGRQMCSTRSPTLWRRRCQGVFIRRRARPGGPDSANTNEVLRTSATS